MATREKSRTAGSLTAGILAFTLRIFSRIHIFAYRRTGGVIGGRIYGNPILLLTTIGRKTGQQRTTPLAYIVDGDTIVIIAGAAGAAQHPAWWLNLAADPEAWVQIGRRTARVRARLATAEEQQRIWARYPAQRALFDSMQRRVARAIPVIVLHPARESA